MESSQKKIDIARHRASTTAVAAHLDGARPCVCRCLTWSVVRSPSPVCRVTMPPPVDLARCARTSQRCAHFELFNSSIDTIESNRRGTRGDRAR
jgi:hypothetical protein